MIHVCPHCVALAILGAAAVCPAVPTIYRAIRRKVTGK